MMPDDYTCQMCFRTWSNKLSAEKCEDDDAQEDRATRSMARRKAQHAVE